MQTIQFKTQDRTQWTIFVNQITCVYQSPYETGTYVRLSCGKELYTLFSINNVLDMIKQKS